MRALALVDAPDHVCCRYRVQAFRPALRARGIDLRVEALRHGTAGRAIQFAGLPRHDAILLQRKLLPGWQVRLLRRRADQFVFDFDDAVLYRDSYDPRGPRSPRRARRFALTVRLADVVIAGNDFLADCALRAGASPERVRVIPTCVPVDRYPIPVREAREAGSVDLVWIGSSSTLKGLEQSRALWDRIGAEAPGARLRVICDRFPDLGRLPVVPVPWDGATESAELAKGDVGVTTIPDDLWSRGKCGLKLLQYQAAGLPVLANPVGVHPEMVRPGRDGFLPADDDEWVAAVKTLAGSPATREAMGKAAREAVESGYSVSAWEDAFVGAITGAGAVPAPGPHQWTPVRGAVSALAEAGGDR